MKKISLIFLFGPVIQEERSFLDISYLELWWPGLFAQCFQTICAIMVVDLMRNIYVSQY